MCFDPSVFGSFEVPKQCGPAASKIARLFAGQNGASGGRLDHRVFEDRNLPLQPLDELLDLIGAS